MVMLTSVKAKWDDICIADINMLPHIKVTVFAVITITGIIHYYCY